MRSATGKTSFKEMFTSAATGGAAAFGATLGAKALAGAALPTIMSQTGVVISGVGTIHGGLTAAAASFAATPVGVPVVLTGAVGGLVYRGFRKETGVDKESPEK